MTLHQIMNHLENWMQTKASPGLPERINFEDLRFAFLPSDLKQPSPFEEAVAAAAPTAGQSVLYHRADGSTARASVKTVHVPPPPPPPVATPPARQGLPIRHEDSSAVKPTMFTVLLEDGSEVCTVRKYHEANRQKAILLGPRHADRDAGERARLEGFSPPSFKLLPCLDL